MVVAGFLFTAGAIVMAVSPNLGCMFAGRVILGFGVGAGTMVSSLLSAAFHSVQGCLMLYSGHLAFFPQVDSVQLFLTICQS